MNYKTVYKTILIFSLFVAIVAGTFMTVSFLHCSDTGSLNVYSPDSVEWYVPVTWLFAVCVAVYVIAAVLFSKRIDKLVDFSSPHSKTAYSMMGLVLVALFVFCLGREFLTDESYDHGNMYVLFKETVIFNTSTTEVSYLYLAFLIAVIASAAFFFYAAFGKSVDYDGKNTGSERFAAMSMLPSLALALKIIYDFLLQSGYGYGALYNYHLIGMGFALLFSVYETRFYFKKALPALYLFFGLTAATSSLIFSVSALALFFAGKAGANWHPAFCIVDVIIVVYIYIRLFSLKVHHYERQKKAPSFTPIIAEDDEAEIDEQAE